MKINIVKPHHKFALGIQEVENGTANYLLKTGVAIEVNSDPAKEKDNIEPAKEKKEARKPKEKQEHKTKVPIQRKKK